MILVTGGLGFIGSHTTKALLDQGEQVVVTQHRNGDVPSFLKNAVDKQLFVEQADVTNEKSLEAIGQKYSVTQIVHLAAPKIGSMDIIDDLENNLQGLFGIIRLGKKWNVKRIMIASSMGVYAGASNPLREDAPLSMANSNPIGAAKKTFEIIGDTIAAQSPDMSIVFVRPSAIWGPLGRPTSMFFSLPQMVHAAVKNSDVGQLFADDGIDMCYVKDCGKAIAFLTTLDKMLHRTYNIGSGKATTTAEIAELIQSLKPSASFTLNDGHGQHAPAVNMYMDMSSLYELGFRPDFDVKQGIVEYMSWLEAGNNQ